MSRVEVGAPVIIVALCSKGFAAPASQTNVLPSLIVAISCCPKLSNDQEPGSRTTCVEVLPSPHSSDPHVSAPPDRDWETTYCNN